MTSEKSAFPFLVENLADVVWEIEPKTLRVLYTNAAITRFLGYTPTEATKLNLRALIAPREWPLVEEHLANSVEHHCFSGRHTSDYSRELEHQHQAGHSVWGEVRLTIAGTSRETLRIFGVTRDLTERRKSEEAGGVTRRLMEGAPCGAFLSTKRKIIWANQEALRLLGAPAIDAVIGRDTFSIVAEEDLPKARERYRTLALSERRPDNEVVRLRRFDGSIAPFEVSSVRVSVGSEMANAIFFRPVAIGPGGGTAHEKSDPFWRLATGLPEAVIVLQHNRVAYANVAAARLFRAASVDELIGLSLETFTGSECSSRLNRQLRHTAELDSESEQSRGDCWLQTLDGASVRVAATILRMRIDGIASVLLLARELTSPSSLAGPARAQLHELHREIPIALGVVRHRRIVDANPALGRLLGFAPDEAVDLPAEQLYADACEFDRVGREITRQMDASGEACVVTQWRRRGGSLVDVELRTLWLHPERDGDWMLCVAQDISQWANLQRESLANATELQAMFDAAPVMYFLVDAAGTCRRINGAAKSFTRFTDAQAVGQSVCQVLQCAFLAGRASAKYAQGCRRCVLRQGIRRAADGVPTMQAELTVELMRDGTPQIHALLVSTTALRNEPGADVLLCIEDITQNRQLADQIRKAQRLDEVGRMAAGIAHDFNNLFFALAVHLSTMQSATGLAPGLRKTLAELEAQARLGNQLCQKLLFFGRQQTPCPVRMEVAAIIKQALNGIRSLLGPDIQLTIALMPRPVHILGDVGMIEQIVINLCLNARDAMPEGGELCVQTEIAECDGVVRGQPPLARTGTFVVLTVSDTGLGMDASMLEHIFEPFFSTKEARRGTGLGLTTVHTIIQRHAGWIEVRSTPGRGTTFEIGLPVAPEESPEG